MQDNTEMVCVRVCFDDALLNCSECSGFNASLFIVLDSWDLPDAPSICALKWGREGGRTGEG